MLKTKGLALKQEQNYPCRSEVVSGSVEKEIFLLLELVLPKVLLWPGRDAGDIATIFNL